MTTVIAPPPATFRGEILARARICVRFMRDDEDGLWHFAVGNPAILGGACHSLEEAERHAAEAIARALSRGRPIDCDADERDMLGDFEVDIRLAPL